MNEPDAQTVASSATDTPAVSTGAIHDMAAYEAMRNAERLGQPPRTDQPTTPASAAGQPAEQAGESVPSSAPASEPGKASGHKGDAESRKAELEAEIQALLKRRAELRRETAPPEPAKTDATPASQPAPSAAEGEPQLEDFENQPDQYPDPFKAWMKAVARWEARQERKAEQEQLKRAQVEAELTARSTAFRKRLDEAFDADPGLRERILLDRFDVVPTSAIAPGEAIAPQNDLAEALLDAERPADLMRHLSESPKAFAALLASQTPREFWRRLGQIEGQMSAAPRKTPKTITDAPEPPQPIGTRASVVSDVDAAVRARDVSAYEAARNRERLAGMRT